MAQVPGYPESGKSWEPWEPFAKNHLGESRKKQRGKKKKYYISINNLEWDLQYFVFKKLHLVRDFKVHQIEIIFNLFSQGTLQLTFLIFSTVL